MNSKFDPSMLHLRPPCAPPGDHVTFQIVDFAFRDMDAPVVDRLGLRELMDVTTPHDRLARRGGALVPPDDFAAGKLTIAELRATKRAPIACRGALDSSLVTVTLFGVTMQGNSVALRILGWRPTLMVELGHKIRPEAVCDALNDALHLSCDRLTFTVEHRKHLTGYEPDPRDPLSVRTFRQMRIACPTIAVWRRLQRALTDEEAYNRLLSPVLPFRWSERALLLNDASVSLSARFCADLQISPSGFVRAPARADEGRRTHKQMEFVCAVDELRDANAGGLENSLAPLLLCSWDIETYSPNDQFPDPSDPACPLACIGLSYWRLGASAPGAPLLRLQLLLDEQSPPSDVTMQCAIGSVRVISFAHEMDVLNAFRSAITVEDIDLLVGYNTSKFDVEYIVRRAKLYSLPTDADPAPFWFTSAFVGELCEPEVTRLSNSAMGDNEGMQLRTPGVVNFDFFIWMKQTYRLEKYTLDFVAKKYLGDGAAKVRLHCAGFAAQRVAAFARAVQELTAQVAPLVPPGTLEPFLRETQALLARGYAREARAGVRAGATLPDHADDGLREAWAEANDDDDDAPDEDDPLRTWNSVIDAIALPESDDLQTLLRALASERRFYRPVRATAVNESALPHALSDGPLTFAQALRSHLQHLFLDARAALGDNNYRMLFALHRHSREARLLNCVYCAVDCDLPLELLHKLGVVGYIKEVSAVSYTPMTQIIGRGQQVKVFNNLFRESSQQGYIMNRVPDALLPWPLDEIEYKGATVLEPVPDFYTDPVATQDFASLYPSIMQAYNLCPSTILLARAAETTEALNGAVRRLSADDPRAARLRAIGKTVQSSPLNPTNTACSQHPDLADPVDVHEIHSSTLHPVTGAARARTQHFAFVQHFTSVSSIILQGLIAKRKVAKALYESLPDDSMEKMVAEKRQLALKLLANAMYGFYGVQGDSGMYACIMVSVAVTSTGRKCIEGSRDYVHAHFGDVREAADKTNAMLALRRADAAFQAGVPYLIVDAQGGAATVRDHVYVPPVGAVVAGEGVPPGTRVLAVDGDALALSAPVSGKGLTLVAVSDDDARARFCAPVAPRNEQARVQVVYGDTDSMMIHIPGFSRLEAFHVALTIQKHLNKLYRAPMKIEFEKVFHPYLLIGKKRYAGLKIEPDAWGLPRKPKADYKGLDVVRRDRCEVLRALQKRLIEKCLLNANYDLVSRSFVLQKMESLYNMVRETIVALVGDTLPLSAYVKSKACKKSYKDRVRADGTVQRGEDAQGHMTVVRKMRERGAMKQYGVGDRVDFVHVIVPGMTCGTANKRVNRSGRRAVLDGGGVDKSAQCTDDPDWAAQNGIAVDRLFYLDHDLGNSVHALLEPLYAHGLPNLSPLWNWARGELARQQTPGQRALSFAPARGAPTFDCTAGKRARPIKAAPRAARESPISAYFSNRDSNK